MADNHILDISNHRQGYRLAVDSGSECDRRMYKNRNREVHHHLYIRGRIPDVHRRPEKCLSIYM